MGLLPLPSLFSLASTCSRLYHLLANPSLWRALHINPSKISHHQGSFHNMLKDKGEHVREITLRNKDLLAGKDKLVLKYAVELCGSNLTSLAVSNLKVVDLKLIAKSCGVLMSLSIGDLILEDLHRVLPWLNAFPNKFKHQSTLLLTFGLTMMLCAITAGWSKPQLPQESSFKVWWSGTPLWRRWCWGGWAWENHFKGTFFACGIFSLILVSCWVDSCSLVDCMFLNLHLGWWKRRASQWRSQRIGLLKMNSPISICISHHYLKNSLWSVFLSNGRQPRILQWKSILCAFHQFHVVPKRITFLHCVKYR